MQNIPALLKLIEINPVYKPYIELAISGYAVRGDLMDAIEKGLKESINYLEGLSNDGSNGRYKKSIDMKKNCLDVIMERGLKSYLDYLEDIKINF